MESHRTSTHNRGFTLTEILIVMALISVVAGLSTIMSMDNYHSYSFSNERDLIVAVLHKARSQAINNMCLGAGCTDGRPHGVHIVGNQYTVFQGPTFAGRDSAVDEIVRANAPVTLTGATDVIFSQLSGSASSTASITISDATAHTSTITINSEGQISWTN